MTSQEKNLLQDIARKPLGSIWGYWAFAFPVLIVIIGIAVQAFLLTYFKQHSTGFEVCIRQGDKVDVLWDSQLVQQTVLTVSLSITATFGLLAFLARQSYKQTGLSERETAMPKYFLSSLTGLIPDDRFYPPINQVGYFLSPCRAGDMTLNLYPPALRAPPRTGALRLC